jgi:beta-lactamase regulating signal transducer with metallopeptidase domain
MISLPVPAHVVDRLGWALVHSLWQFAAIAFFALALEHALRRRTAALRYGVLLLALVVMAASPAVTWFFLPLEVPPPVEVVTEPLVHATPPANAAGTGFDRIARAAEPPPSDPDLAAPITPASQSPAARIGSWRSWAAEGVRPWLAEIVCLWIAGVAAFSFRPLLSWRTVRRLRTIGVSSVPASVQRSLERTAARLRLRKGVQVFESTLVNAPLMLGYLRPIVLLPVNMAAGLPVSQLEGILAHELAHIRRHDYLINLVQTLFETVFFYHPAMWWLSARIRRERENCCDDLAAEALGSRVEYGRALLALQELRGASTTLALGARSGSFLQRIRRLFEREPAEPALGVGSVVGLGLFATAILLASVWVETLGDQPSPRGPGDAAPRKPVEATQPKADDPAASQPAAAETPKRTHIPGHDRSAVAWQTGDKVHFVLYAQGFLQTGLEETFYPTGEWRIRGHINLLKDRQEVRRFEIRHSSAEPDTLYLEGKAYAMDAYAKPNSTDGVTRSGRLFILREHGEPLQTARTLPLKSEADLDPKQPGSLAALADRDLYLAETYRLSRDLDAQEGWVIAWDVQHAAQHSDGARIARLRVFSDGRVAAWQGLGKPLVEKRIARDEVNALVSWLIDEKGATPRRSLQVIDDAGKKRELFLDPLPTALWDQFGDRVAVKRDGQTYDLVSISPGHDDVLPQIPNNLPSDVIDRLQQLIQAAGGGGEARQDGNPLPSNSQTQGEKTDAPLITTNAVNTNSVSDTDAGPVWGDAVDGLQLGVSGIQQDRHFTTGDTIRFHLNVRNVGKQAIRFAYNVPETYDWVAPDVETANGAPVRLQVMRFRGGHRNVSETLEPGAVAPIQMYGILVLGDSDTARKDWPRLEKPEPGEYTLRARFLVHPLDADGKQIIERDADGMRIAKSSRMTSGTVRFHID